MTTAPSLAEHPADIFAVADGWRRDGRAFALAFVTATQGGAVRDPGAVMAISADGETVGYLSGGCIDADVASQARACLTSRQTRTLRYGVGSPFFDIQLPCGGAIDVFVCPYPDENVVTTVAARLAERQETSIVILSDGSLRADPPDASTSTDVAFSGGYAPKLRLRLAGRGADLIAMARIAAAAGIEARVQSPDQACLDGLTTDVNYRADLLRSPELAPTNDDDPWTAFVLMFHDPEWELTLLKDAISNPAFYIGAVGSRATHARRVERLAAMGCSAVEIARIHAPAGLVPSMRDASGVAVSTFAEIIDVFHRRPSQ